ncbi:uncharacterized protein LOC126685763 [Mercurialis annua]|uniref:uncharacterized protein LOC126685763 n=1 Tax=Mercurialis annua TaxID=3986 RepID=UPI0021606374|nr:uncharacterized protein LOC126685763 [Mercurialis annua]
MGNCLRTELVHPLNNSEKDVDKSSSNCNVRIKVKITKKQLMELMARVDLSNGGAELGRVILQECLDGKLTARVVGGGHGLGLASEATNCKNLATIKED